MNHEIQNFSANCTVNILFKVIWLRIWRQHNKANDEQQDDASNGWSYTSHGHHKLRHDPRQGTQTSRVVEGRVTIATSLTRSYVPWYLALVKVVITAELVHSATRLGNAELVVTIDTRTLSKPLRTAIVLPAIVIEATSSEISLRLINISGPSVEAHLAVVGCESLNDRLRELDGWRGAPAAILTPRVQCQATTSDESEGDEEEDEVGDEHETRTPDGHGSAEADAKQDAKNARHHDQPAARLHVRQPACLQHAEGEPELDECVQRHDETENA